MLTITVDTKALQTWANQQLASQAPFAISLALNRTAKSVQDTERAGLAQHFTIRKPWVPQGVMIPRFSDKRDVPMQVEIVVDKSRQFLWKFEEGGTKTGTPNTPIAIPSRAIRPGFTALPPLDLYPKNLRLLARRTADGVLPPKIHWTAHGVAQRKGKQRTFVLEADWMGVRVPGVYQRTGPGKHDFRLLWTYRARIPIPAALHFYEIAQETVKAAWPVHFAAAWQYAVRTAR